MEVEARAAGSPCRIELLGGLRVRRGDRLILRFRTRQTGALLGYLALHRQRAHLRDELAALCWPDSAGDTRHQLRNALTSLRRQLEPPGIPPGSVIRADRASVQLNPERVTTDVAAFEAALQAARGARGAARRQQLMAAVALYGGELLPGYLDPWIVPERQRLLEAYVKALAQLVADHEQQGDFPRALEYARRMVAADPMREEGQHELIRLLIAAGHPEVARQQYAELEWLLAREIGVAPAAQTRTLLVHLPQLHHQPPPGTVAPIGARAPRPGRPRTDPEGTSARDPDRLRPESAGSDAPAAAAAAPRPPLGTVTFLLVEFAAPHAQSPAEQSPPDGLAEGLRDLLLTVRRQGGVLLRQESGSLLVAFERAGNAAAAAAAGMQMWGGEQERKPDASEAAAAPAAPAGGARPRMALHTGELGPDTGAYDGPALARARTLLLAAHPGQILCSETTAALLRAEEEPAKPGYPIVSLGAHRLRDPHADTPLLLPLFHLRYAGMPQREFPAPRGALPHAGALPHSFTRFFGREAEIEHLCALVGETEDGGRGTGDGRRWTGDGSGERRFPPDDRPPSPVHRLPSPVCRLITLTGPGGSGKSRLAVEVARRLVQPFRGAVWFVPLADLKQAALVTEAIRTAMRLPSPAGRTPLDLVAEVLARQPSLLLLDNCEHLIEPVAAVIRALLERVPTLTLLATSRQPLALEGEQLFAVAPLPVPGVQAFRRSGVQAFGGTEAEAMHEQRLNTRPPERRTPERLNGLLDCASIRLFVDRAQAVLPDFGLTETNAAAVAAVCTRLEGLPLAIELAAARVGLVSLAEMLAHLEHRFRFLVSRKRSAIARHASLEAALEWSYQLLTPELQRFFARLSVFRGGWTPGAAAAVALEESAHHGGTDRRREALKHLEHLQQCSLIIAEEAAGGPPGVDSDLARLTEAGWSSRADQSQDPTRGLRYQMLETVREYGAERLVEREEAAAVGQRHLQYFSGFLDTVLADHSGPRQIRGSAQVEREDDNLRAALAWALEHDPGAGLWFAARLCPFWNVRGHWREAREWLERLLSQSAPASPHSRAAALVEAGALAYRQSDFDLAVGLLKQALRQGQVAGDPGAIANALTSLGSVATARGDYDEARLLFDESLSIVREINPQRGVAAVLASQGLPALQQGDYARARRLYEESLALRGAAGEREGAAASLVQLGTLAQAEGNNDEAARFFERGLAVAREFKARLLIASALHGLGRVAHARGEAAQARAFHEESLAIRHELHDRRGVVHVLETFGDVELAAGDLTRARDCFRESLLICREIGLKPLIPSCLEGLAKVAARQSQAEQATQLFGAAAALREALGAPLYPSRRPDYERYLATLRYQLGEAAFAAAWSAGRALTVEQALAEALRETPCRAPGRRG